MKRIIKHLMKDKGISKYTIIMFCSGIISIIISLSIFTLNKTIPIHWTIIGLASIVIGIFMWCEDVKLKKLSDEIDKKITICEASKILGNKKDLKEPWESDPDEWKK